VIESMTGGLVHDSLEQEGWGVEIADAHRVKGLAPLACKTDKIDSRVKHKSALKNRVHSTLINFGKPCPVTDSSESRAESSLPDSRSRS
jgi:transposase